jgi:cytochrome c-type biogenesis protein CcmF
VLVTVAIEFQKGTRARSAIEKEGTVKAFFSLFERNRRRYGGYIVHVGLVITFMGFAGAAYNVEHEAVLQPGESTEMRSPFGHTYRLTYQDMSWYTATNMTKLIASVRVEKDGRPTGILTTERRAYRQRTETTTEVGIQRAWNEDLYLILAGIDDANAVVRGTNPRPVTTFRMLVNPLVPWIWIGGLIMAIGTLIAMWPAAPPVRERVPGTQRESPAEREPELVGA